jgi:hypothetical protein
MVLIAYYMLESSFGAYIEWWVNKLMMAANKNKCKDAHLAMLLAVAINPQARKPCIILGVFSFLLTGKSCGVQLSTQGLFYPVAGDRFLELTFVCGNLLVGSVRISFTLRI